MTKWHLIDPELRPAGRLMQGLFDFSSVNKMRRAQKWINRLMVGKKPKSIAVEEVFIEAYENKQLRMCIYRPKDSEGALPGVLWLHGGGYAIGAPEMSLDYFERLIAKRQCVIVAPDYSLSVDRPFPAAFEECYSALLWMKAHGAVLHVNVDQLILAGVSAGGGLTAALAIAARDRGDVKIAFQMPLYPMLDDRERESSKANTSPVWNTANNLCAWQLYVGEAFRTAEVSKYAAPSRETDFTNLPPLYTFIGTQDPFYDEVLDFVKAIQQAGGQAEVDVYEGCYHGFEEIGRRTKIGKRAIERFVEAFGKAVDRL